MKISKIPKNIRVNSKGTQFTFNNQDYTIPLFGSHQARNAALAIDVVNQFDPKIKYDMIYKSLKKVFWPGRMQKIRPKIFYDVSHNKEGMEKTLQTLKELYPDEDIHGLLCLKKDKDLTSLKSVILKNFKNLFISEDKKGLLLKSSILEKKLARVNIKCKPVSSIKKGSENIENIVKNNSAVGLIFGSHYIAEEVFQAFEIPFDNYYI
jgi:folylpolyglutamate synthase/dihydropteroate synthase